MGRDNPKAFNLKALDVGLGKSPEVSWLRLEAADSDDSFIWWMNTEDMKRLYRRIQHHLNLSWERKYGKGEDTEAMGSQCPPND